MKKFLNLSIIALFVVVLSGCGKGADIVCTGTVEEDGQTYKAKIEANLDGNKVSKAKATMEFSDKETADTMCGMLALSNSMSEEQIDYKCSGKKITFNDFLQMGGGEEYTKEEFIEEMEDEGLSCK